MVFQSCSELLCRLGFWWWYRFQLQIRFLSCGYDVYYFFDWILWIKWFQKYSINYFFILKTLETTAITKVVHVRFHIHLGTEKPTNYIFRFNSTRSNHPTHASQLFAYSTIQSFVIYVSQFLQNNKNFINSVVGLSWQKIENQYIKFYGYLL